MFSHIFWNKNVHPKNCFGKIRADSSATSLQNLAGFFLVNGQGDIPNTNLWPPFKPLTLSECSKSLLM